jgi:hypothetical protein
VASAVISSRSLPTGPLAIGYANWEQCDEKIDRAVANGVNVVIWFATNLGTIDGRPAITGNSIPDLACVAATVVRLNSVGLFATHLISIGGWNAPHPNTTFTADEWWATWRAWNDAAATDEWPGGFDGIDWDLEGNDDFDSSWNFFTVECIRLVSDLSYLAKRDGFIVGMAPPQSYLEVDTAAFSLNVTHA